MKPSKGYIYLLCHPITGDVRYVGRTNDPKQRYRNHVSMAKLNKPWYVQRWIRKLHADGLKPRMEIFLETKTYEETALLERSAIKLFKEKGYKLTNTTDGGEGTSGRKCSSEETERNRRSQLRLWSDPAHRQKMSDAHKGKKQSPEQIAKRVASARHYTSSRENFERNSKLFKGRPKPAGSGKLPRPIQDNFGTKYSSIAEATKTLKVPNGSICRILKGRRKSIHGYSFSYLDE